MTDRLGAWSNAPLAYALAEVRTERLSDIEEYQPKLAGRLRESYPIQRTTKTMNVISSRTQLVVEPSPDTAWEYATPDNRVAVILRANGLVLHATRYEDSRTFLTQLDDVVEAFAEEVPSVYVNRLGLRYIDFVLPRRGEVPEDYVDERLNPDLGLSDKTERVTTTSMSVYQMAPDIVLNLRYTRAHGQPELPPDLGVLSLDKSPLMTDGVPDGRPTAVLDVDCQHTHAPIQRLEPGLESDRFASVYKISFDAFMIAITDHARKVWGART